MMVREARKGIKEEWILSIAENFKDNKKTFWKGVKEVGKGREYEGVVCEKLNG